MQPKEITIDIGRMLFSALEWGDPDGRPVIALHGWLDNAASFAPMAPMLRGVRLIALDLAGHGYSEHRPAEMDYAMWHYVEDLVEIADHLGLTQFSLMGHSMGAAVAVMTAAVLGDRVEKILLLDGLIPIPQEASDSPKVLAAYLSEQQSYRQKASVSQYKSLEQAIRIRLLSTFKLSRASAELLVRRSIKSTDDVWVWRTDSRLKLPSPIRFTQKQALAFAEQISCEAHVLYVKEGYMGATIEPLRNQLSHMIFYPFSGEHHFHMDDHVESVAAIANAVFCQAPLT